jgi:CheY-like chemotaxis protein
MGNLLLTTSLALPFFFLQRLLLNFGYYCITMDKFQVSVASPAQKSLHVLVADDNPVNRRMLIGLLTSLGHTGTVVGDGVAVLQCLSKHTFDVVFMDMQMPKMDGFETLQTVRAHEKVEGGHLPIIMVTAYADRIDQFRYQKAGADGLVSKPFDMGKLHSALQNLLGTYRIAP